VRLLILGGTVFLGRHLVDAALARGHDVTIFHRGRQPAHRPGDVDEMFGDRDGGLDALRGRSWDAVIDTSVFVPRLVHDSAVLLSEAVGHYTFVSSVSAYADVSGPVNEDTPVHAPPAADVEGPIIEHYGPLKVGCEQAALAALPGRVLIQRPGLIVGPHDPTDRFTYWVRRVAAGGEMLAPAPPDAPVQVIDARDLAAWTLDTAEGGVTGVLNAIGPRGTDFAGLLATCVAETRSAAEITWVDEQFLLDEGLGPWEEVPLWLPADFRMRGMLDVDDTRARAAGLRTRPLAETVRDLHAWDRERGAPVVPQVGARHGSAGLDARKEAAVLSRWRARMPG
jgi:2'-hydroxyisoflavone reductase